MRPIPAPLAPQKRYELGQRAAEGYMYQQDKIWSRYSNDKVNIAHGLTSVLRTLHKALPLEQPLAGLSIGSSNEPQFRILEAACRGGLYLLDIEQAALAVVAERTARQNTLQVKVLHDDFRQVLRDREAVCAFLTNELVGQRLTLITLHHSLYYCPESSWRELLANLYEVLLEPSPAGQISAAIHAVLMASQSDDPATTTWLYNHFAEKFFDCHNDQDLLACAGELAAEPRLKQAQLQTATSRVEFFVDDFEQFMAVVWMILLHPNVHRFTEPQQREVIDWVYDNLWSVGQPLVQLQDHLAIYRGSGPTAPLVDFAG